MEPNELPRFHFIHLLLPRFRVVMPSDLSSDARQLLLLLHRTRARGHTLCTRSCLARADRAAGGRREAEEPRPGKKNNKHKKPITLSMQ